MTVRLITEPGETGFVEGNTRRHSVQASTSLTQYLGIRHMIRYQLGMSDIDYDRTLGTGLVGYRYPSLGLLYAATLSPRLDLTLTANAARLEVPQTQRRNRYTRRAGWLSFPCHGTLRSRSAHRSHQHAGARTK